jgi:hypothetical protein
MTWKSIFDLSTMQHQHIVYTYVTVIVVQCSYLARLAYIWTHPRSPQA